jgi:hypothetical protein
MPTRYESHDACAANTVSALAASGDFEFPSLVAECRPASAPAAQRDPKARQPSDSRQG